MQAPLKTFPKCGHPMNEANIYVRPNGRTLQCRFCRKAVNDAYKAKHVPTHCRNGHELTPGNIRYTLTGQRRCKKCLVEWKAKRDHHAKSEKPRRNDEPAAEEHPVLARFWGIELPEYLQAMSVARKTAWVADRFWRMQWTMPTLILVPAEISISELPAWMAYIEVRHARPGELGERDGKIWWVR